MTRLRRPAALAAVITAGFIVMLAIPAQLAQWAVLGILAAVIAAACLSRD